MYNINSYHSTKAFEPYHSYQRVPDPGQHDLDPLANCCCICYNPYSFATTNPDAEDPVQLPMCGHIFGAICWQKWAETSSTCPLCRAELDFQNDDMLNLEYLGWQSHVNAGGESEAEYFDAQENCTESHHQSCEDVWLTIAYEEEYAMHDALRPSYCRFNIGPIHDLDCAELVDIRKRYASSEQFPLDPYPPFEQYPYSADQQSTKACQFDDLVDCHKTWMTSSFDDDDDDEDSDDEFVLSYHDIFLY